MRASELVDKRVRINDEDPYYPGGIGTVYEGGDHYVRVRVDGGGATTVHEGGVVVIAEEA
jgi:hypothetical protein